MLAKHTIKTQCFGFCFFYLSGSDIQADPAAGIKEALKTVHVERNNVLLNVHLYNIRLGAGCIIIPFYSET